MRSSLHPLLLSSTLFFFSQGGGLVNVVKEMGDVLVCGRDGELRGLLECDFRLLGVGPPSCDKMKRCIYMGSN